MGQGAVLHLPPGQEPHRQSGDEGCREPGELLSQFGAKALVQRTNDHADVAAQSSEQGGQADARDQVEVQAAHALLARRCPGLGGVIPNRKGVVGPQDRHADDERQRDADVAL